MLPTPRALSLSFSLRVKNRHNEFVAGSRKFQQKNSNSNDSNDNHIYECPPEVVAPVATILATQTLPAPGKAYA